LATSLEPTPVVPSPGGRVTRRLQRVFDSDIAFSFRNSPVAVTAFVVTACLFALALLAPWLAPHNTDDVATLNLMDARLPPYGFTDQFGIEGISSFLLGTDDQGRDILSAIMFGLQVSLGVGFASVILAASVGTFLGLLSGYVGGLERIVPGLVGQR